jgi:hypothetical protein
MRSDRPSLGSTDAHKRSIHERFAIPYVFSPNLSLGAAASAAMGALARILLGSLLFAFWGISSAMIWNSVDSHFWRAIITVPLGLLLVVSMGGLMLGITAIGNLIAPRTK